MQNRHFALGHRVCEGAAIVVLAATFIRCSSRDDGRVTDTYATQGEAVSTDGAPYNFEGSTQGFVSSGSPITSLRVSTNPVFSGNGSLAVNLGGASGTASASVGPANVPAGATVTFHVLCSNLSAISAVQVYALQGQSGGWAWTGNYQSSSSLSGGWNTLAITLPSKSTSPLFQLGVQFVTNSSVSTTCYLDSIGWPSGNLPPPLDAGVGAPDTGTPPDSSVAPDANTPPDASKPKDASGSTGSPGSSAAGVIPRALPARMLIGWGAQNYTDTWAQQSGAKFDVQWTYLTGQGGNNWYNSWGGGPADGSLLDDLLKTVDGLGFIPGIHLYNMGYGHDQGDSGLVTEIQNAAWTKEYFTEFKVMMQKVKNFGKPVVIVLEGDSFGMIEMLTSNNPSTFAAVASSGLPELAGLPNTVAGFGMAYLAIRKSVGVSNVAMGPDTPYYAANGDLMNWPPTDTQNLQPFVDYQWQFFGPLGVGANSTGDTFDFSASCPRASDMDAFTDGRAVWSSSDTASVNTPSINRYVAWLKLYNVKSNVRWVLHQVPIGNSQHTDTPYSSNVARSGYRDIFVEHLFQYESPASTALRTQHLTDFANAGVVGMLFGFSDDGDMPTNDLWRDNQPFFKTHVAALMAQGGFPISSAGK